MAGTRSKKAKKNEKERAREEGHKMEPTQIAVHLYFVDLKAFSFSHDFHCLHFISKREHSYRK